MTNKKAKAKDQTNGGGDGKISVEGTNQELKSLPITIHAQYLKDLSFECPNSPAVLIKQKLSPEIDVDLKVNAESMADFKENSYEVSVIIVIKAETADGIAFISDLTYAGLFTIEGVPEDSLEPVLMIECPRLLFPFIRAIIGHAARDAGFPPLMLNPLDFADLYRRNKAAAQPVAGNA
ncbi:MAG: protein-export chaperone SecB [Rhodospirillaceae bacterium]|nr:protein-export chaperone SecB [Rhodospirillaceae bacterium]MDP6304789.1 protein-export chaperone SecB [Alphaproteobacteria bacterium]MDP7310944.1 protein-export chaperone SecB [Alphaproteobacteria bacterium]MDP7669086.1 protein-export chaperone SecB [Alphaproteobacteria bacterium]